MGLLKEVNVNIVQFIDFCGVTDFHGFPRVLIGTSTSSCENAQCIPSIILAGMQE